MGHRGVILPRRFYDRPVVEVARDLLGCVVSAAGVSIRLTEVEAYDGGNDPASHAYRGQTARNAVMFGPPGHAYVYFTYGMHFCMNLVCGPVGTAQAVLLRAGHVVSGVEIARARRPAARSDRDLARGPARICQALTVDRSLDGVDVTARASTITVSAGTPVPDAAVRVGPRIGISVATDWPYRFWVDGDPTVSAFRTHVPRRRTRA
ncbi:MAG TPA: DNA-3-methyladenine glycosylase [Mycobacteriales bacterium]|nr:DNA-3-methyladenine glycosylase [Mycobacteriales bacterium]